MSNNWRDWLANAYSCKIVSEEQYEVLEKWGFSDHEYPLSIDKNAYRDSEVYQNALKNRKWYRFYGSTTGSSGQPFTSIIDLRTRVLRGLHWQNQIKKMREDTCLVLMWRNKKPSLNQRRLIALGKLVLLPIYDLTGTNSSFISNDNVSKALASLSNNKKYTFRSYVSVLKYLAQNFSPVLKMLNIRCVIASGETLTAADWDLIESGFGCPCINVYGGTEASPIAISSLEDRRLKIQDELFHVGVHEIDGVKNITVTDKINTICPAFAYQIGDVTDGIEYDKEGVYLKNVLGRTSEIIENSRGEMISSHFVHIIFRDEIVVSKYRVFSKGNGDIDISLEMLDESKFEEVSQRVEEKFSALGFDVENIKSENIPMLAGLKHRTIIRV